MSKAAVASILLAVVFSLSSISCQGTSMTKGPSASAHSVPAPAPAAVSTPSSSGPYGFLATVSAASVLVIPLLGFAAFMGRR